MHFLFRPSMSWRPSRCSLAFLTPFFLAESAGGGGGLSSSSSSQRTYATSAPAMIYGVVLWNEKPLWTPAVVLEFSGMWVALRELAHLKLRTSGPPLCGSRAPQGSRRRAAQNIQDCD